MEHVSRYVKTRPAFVAANAGFVHELQLVDVANASESEPDTSDTVTYPNTQDITQRASCGRWAGLLDEQDHARCRDSQPQGTRCENAHQPSQGPSQLDRAREVSRTPTTVTRIKSWETGGATASGISNKMPVIVWYLDRIC